MIICLLEMMKIEMSSEIAKFLPWTVVAFTKLGSTRRTDLERKADNFIFESIEHVSNTISYWYAVTGVGSLSVTAKWRCSSGR